MASVSIASDIGGLLWHASKQRKSRCKGGVILLALPAAFLLSVFLFLTVAAFMGDLAQYKEIKRENEKVDVLLADGHSYDDHKVWRHLLNRHLSYG